MNFFQIVFFMLLCTMIEPVKLEGQDYAVNMFRTKKDFPEYDTNDKEKSFFKNNGSKLLKVKSVTIYGGGSLYDKIASRETENNENITASGSIGLNFFTDRINVNIYYSLNDKQTLEMNTLEQFGSNLLSPKRNGQSFSFSTNYWINKYLGLNLNYLAVNNTWKLDTATTVRALPQQVKVGLTFVPFDFDATNVENLNFAIKSHWIYREIGGEFSEIDRVIEGKLFEPRSYQGWEISSHIYLNDIEVYFAYMRNPDYDNKDNFIPSYSKAQLVLGINVSGGLTLFDADKNGR